MSSRGRVKKQKDGTTLHEVDIPETGWTRGVAEGIAPAGAHVEAYANFVNDDVTIVVSCTSGEGPSATAIIRGQEAKLPTPAARALWAYARAELGVPA